MKPLARLLAVGFWLVAGSLVSSCAAPAAQSQDNSSERLGAWSKPVNGIRGRLIITDRLNNGEPSIRRGDGDKTFCVYAELQNVSSTGYAVAWESPYTMNSTQYAMVLTDGTGTLVPREKWIIGFDAFMLSEWIHLPSETTFRFFITSGTYQHPRSEPAESVVVSLGMDQPWRVSSGPPQPYFLGCTFTPKESAEYRDRASSDGQLHVSLTTWHGTLELPRVAIPPRTK